jgi:hypothetical protein
MTKDLTEDEKLLAAYMSDISERCYDAGWMENVEYALWEAIVSGPRNFGRGIITQSDIDQLTKLSNKVNSWIVFDNDMGEIAMPLDKWKTKFLTDVKRKPNILFG